MDSFEYVKLESLNASTVRFFLNPFGKSMTDVYLKYDNISALSEQEKEKQIEDLKRNADDFEKYQLIRLPEWLGGNKNVINSYRAYSMVDIISHCFAEYWGEEGRQRIEDPCHSNMYRHWDGMVYVGFSIHGSSGGRTPAFTSCNLAMPQIRIGVDNEGYIVAYKPDNNLYGDGVVGEGRRISPDKLAISNKKMIEAISEYAGYKVPIPSESIGFDLIDRSRFFYRNKCSI